MVNCSLVDCWCMLLNVVSSQKKKKVVEEIRAAAGRTVRKLKISARFSEVGTEGEVSIEQGRCGCRVCILDPYHHHLDVQSRGLAESASTAKKGRLVPGRQAHYTLTHSTNTLPLIGRRLITAASHCSASISRLL